MIRVIMTVIIRKDQKFAAASLKKIAAVGLASDFFIIPNNPPARKIFTRKPIKMIRKNRDINDDRSVRKADTELTITSKLSPSANNSVTILLPKTLLIPACIGRAIMLTINNEINQMRSTPFQAFTERIAPDLKDVNIFIIY
jgi:hypothetical protein